MKPQLVNKAYNTIVYGIGRWRAMVWKLFLKRMGERVELMGGVMITSPQMVTIGNDVRINKDVKIIGQFGVTIGDHVTIGFNAILTSADHNYEKRLNSNLGTDGFSTAHSDINKRAFRSSI